MIILIFLVGFAAGAPAWTPVRRPALHPVHPPGSSGDIGPRPRRSRVISMLSRSMWDSRSEPGTPRRVHGCHRSRPRSFRFWSTERMNRGCRAAYSGRRHVIGQPPSRCPNLATETYRSSHRGVGTNPVTLSQVFEDSGYLGQLRAMPFTRGALRLRTVLARARSVRIVPAAPRPRP